MKGMGLRLGIPCTRLVTRCPDVWLVSKKALFNYDVTGAGGGFCLIWLLDAEPMQDAGGKEWNCCMIIEELGKKWVGIWIAGQRLAKDTQ